MMWWNSGQRGGNYLEGCKNRGSQKIGGKKMGGLKKNSGVRKKNRGSEKIGSKKKVGPKKRREKKIGFFWAQGGV